METMETLENNKIKADVINGEEYFSISELERLIREKEIEVGISLPGLWTNSDGLKGDETIDPLAVYVQINDEDYPAVIINFSEELRDLIRDKEGGYKSWPGTKRMRDQLERLVNEMDDWDENKAK